ncbi:phosphocholine cytidylyltransferase family protein [Pedobacter endophyticus]|uniref:NTP transferase domain-containing protein n=1 Tax=Pedobacter endophyticus TaxID=2789740 RepID=A0A7S9PYA8_9SPHI|nr:NTP transferase domain-containing protein [Pedobacter endophyticus]QPH38948.1 NTP transferase domain-containing protein [Pedobacter endophyticus]
MIAIILAAGSGRRLKTNKPKGMLNIGNKPLIDYSISSLKRVGVQEIIIATGYGLNYYERYFSMSGLKTELTFCHNPEFENSGSLYTLYLVLQSLKKYQDLVILDSDILYNVDEFSEFMQSPFKDAVFATNVPKERYDACYIESDISDHLVKITKNINYITPNSLNEYWEHIGIIKTSAESIKDIIGYAEKKIAFGGSLDHEYDYAFESINRPYKVIKFKDYVWSEADDDTQLNHMLNNVYPKLNLY